MPVKETELLMKPDLIRATIDNQKDQTRRVVKLENFDGTDPFYETKSGIIGRALDFCPYGGPGDRIYIKETYSILEKTDDHYVVVYKEDFNKGPQECTKRYIDISSLNDKQIDQAERAMTRTFTSPLFMPKWAARLWLEITAIRVERIADITAKDAIAEGIAPPIMKNNLCPSRDALASALLIQGFFILWDSIYEKLGFGIDVNPWVWVILYKRLPHDN
jgi:hypothetical protein